MKLCGVIEDTYHRWHGARQWRHVPITFHSSNQTYHMSSRITLSQVEVTNDRVTTYLGKSCSFCLPRVPFVNCRQFMYLVISLLVLRAGCGIWLYQFLIIAYLFTLHSLFLCILWTNQSIKLNLSATEAPFQEKTWSMTSQLTFMAVNIVKSFTQTLMHVFRHPRNSKIPLNT